jgi:hypothetical protein
MPREFVNIASSIGKAIKERRRPEDQPLPKHLSALLARLGERENQTSRASTKKKPRMRERGFFEGWEKH